MSKVVLIQIWGAGGGSGALRGQKAGAGGGGCCVECLVHVRPGEKLTVVVGHGGGAGVYGKLVQAPPSIATGEEVLEMVDEFACAPGGQPGGGRGHSGNSQWAAGGGGGYSAVSRKGVKGVELLVVAGGGGGGGSRNGVPGGALHGEEPPTEEEIMRGLLCDERDPLNGRGSLECGGAAGEVPPASSLRTVLMRMQIRSNKRFKQMMQGRKPINLSAHRATLCRTAAVQGRGARISGRCG